MTFPKYIGGQIELKQLTKRQQEVVELIQQNPAISRGKLSAILEINESAVQKHIDTLKEKQIIQREGGTKGRWKILMNH